MTPPPGKNATRRAALIVDPDTTHLTLLKGMLEDEMNVILAHSGSECLAIIENTQPSIVLMERKLPDSDGYEICRRLKDKMGAQSCPVLILSGEKDPYEKMAGYQHGCDEFLNKPFRVDELLTKILLAIELHAIPVLLRKRSRIEFPHFKVNVKPGEELTALAHFAEAAQHCQSYDELGHLTIQSMAYLNLDICLRFKTQAITCYLGCEPNAAEEHVLAMCSSKIRINAMGKRIIINHKNVSLLVTNMPIDNQQRYDNSKECLNIISSMVDTQLYALDQQKRQHAFSDEAVNKASISRELTNLNRALARESKRLRQSAESLEKISAAHPTLASEVKTLRDIDIHLADVEDKVVEIGKKAARNG